MDKHLVFVYGSLRRGNALSMPVRFPGARLMGEARVGGRLYDLGAFPGLALGGSESSVAGEVYEVDEEALKRLDDFEASSRYRRERVEVSAVGGGRLECWVYVPEDGVEAYARRTPVASGDWVEHLAAREGGGTSARPPDTDEP